MKWIATLLGVSIALLSSAVSAQCVPCGGCSDPCATSTVTVTAGSGCGGSILSDCGGGTVSTGTTLGSAVGGGEVLGETICEPMTMYKVVMESKYVTEKRPVMVNKTRSETRFRTKTVYNTVPVTETKYRQKVVSVPKTETKTVEYSVLVPVKSEKTVTLTEMVPSWKEVPEEYTVQVPVLIDVPESYTVKVPQLKDEQFTYTVNVPQAVTEQRTRTVTNAVPVTKTRTVKYCVPTTTMQTVTKDYGHWEDQVVEVAAAPAPMVVSVGGCGSSYATRGGCGGCSTPCGGCGGCGSVVSRGCGGTVVSGGCGGSVVASARVMASSAGCGTTTMTKRVWVPNVKTETVPVTTSTTQEQVVTYTVYEQQSEQVPYECTRIVYQPETRTGTKQTVVYEDEVRTRNRKVVQYNTETRTRMRKELVYNSVEKTETIPYVTYKSEKRSKEVDYTYNVPEYMMESYETTRYDRIASEAIEEYTVSVSYCETELQDVQVCKMVPRLVAETVNPCCESTSVGTVTYGDGGSMGGSVISGGCGGCAPVAPAPAPCGSCAPPVGSPCGC